MRNKKVFFGLSVLIFFFFSVVPVFAADLVAPSKDSPNILVGAKEIRKNLYAAGANVTVNGDIMGDLVSAGGMVTIVGKVEESALVAGGTMQISGPVGTHLRLIGGNITISSPVGGDLVIAGGNINLSANASVAGDLIIAGGNTVVDAPVAGKVKIIGGSVILNSKVGGDVMVKTFQDLTFGNGAEISGKIEHTGIKPAIVSPSAKISSVQFTKIENKNFKKEAAAFISLGFLIKLLAWFFAGLVITKLLKKQKENFISEFRSKPWENLGYGLIFAIVGPVLALLLFLTFVGYYLGFLLGVGFVFILATSCLLGAVLSGYYLLSVLNKSQTIQSDWQAVLIGIVVWILLGFVPLLGWLIQMVLFFMALGILIKAIKSVIKDNN